MAPTTGPSRRETWRTRLYRWDSKGAPYAFVAPFFLVFAAFGLFPLLYTGWLSLHQVSLYNVQSSRWISRLLATTPISSPARPAGSSGTRCATPSRWERSQRCRSC